MAQGQATPSYLYAMPPCQPFTLNATVIAISTPPLVVLFSVQSDQISTVAPPSPEKSLRFGTMVVSPHNNFKTENHHLPSGGDLIFPTQRLA
jgi:hypothetical protein